MEMTTFQITSDLHIEYKNDTNLNPLDFITPSSNILIMAGDIGSLYKMNQLQSFLEETCRYFEVVLYIPGNQEYYIIPGIQSEPMDVLVERLQVLNDSIENLHVLNRSSVRIGNICIAGCTLWSDLNIDIPKYIVRIHMIKNHIYKKYFETDLQYIKDMIGYCKDEKLKLVVVTHHGPTSKVLLGSNKRLKLRSLYYSNLDNLLDINHVHTWICGHIHRNFDFITEQGTRVVGNQKGKPKDKNYSFTKNFIISI